VNLKNNDEKEETNNNSRKKKVDNCIENNSIENILKIAVIHDFSNILLI
jgi:hypothetical protein